MSTYPDTYIILSISQYLAYIFNFVHRPRQFHYFVDDQFIDIAIIFIDLGFMSQIPENQPPEDVIHRPLES